MNGQVHTTKELKGYALYGPGGDTDAIETLLEKALGDRKKDNVTTEAQDNSESDRSRDEGDDAGLPSVDINLENLEPDYGDTWWPEEWDRGHENCDMGLIEAMFRDALKYKRGNYLEFFKWGRCQANGLNEGRNLGRHVGPDEDPNNASNKRRRR
ncbi:MAG: hypothetical protein Q9222_001935 [Ikaeria aurantiellina]